jgi:hypothetical protein
MKIPTTRRYHYRAAGGQKLKCLITERVDEKSIGTKIIVHHY